jgi:hypothetical protein
MHSANVKKDTNANGLEMGDTPVSSSRTALTEISYSHGRSRLEKCLIVLVLILFVIAGVFIGLYTYEKLNQKDEAKRAAECSTEGCVKVSAGM